MANWNFKESVPALWTIPYVNLKRLSLARILIVHVCMWIFVWVCLIINLARIIDHWSIHWRNNRFKLFMKLNFNDAYVDHGSFDNSTMKSVKKSVFFLYSKVINCSTIFLGRGGWQVGILCTILFEVVYVSYHVIWRKNVITSETIMETNKLG